MAILPPSSLILTTLKERGRRLFGYLAVLRPSLVFALILIGLPLTRLGWPSQKAGAMLGNLFVDYHGLWGFWFAVALYLATLEIMLITCLVLTGERDSPYRWVYDPRLDGKPRRVAIPMARGDWITFTLFSLLALPGYAIVLWNCEDPLTTLIGILAGSLVAYFILDSLISVQRIFAPGFRVLPWQPLILQLLHRLVGIEKLHKRTKPARGFLRWVSSKLHFFLPPHFYRTDDPATLQTIHLFSFFCLLGAMALYVAIYLGLKPERPDDLTGIEMLPPASFLYLLLFPIIGLVSFLWAYLRRYRVTFLIIAALTLAGYIFWGAVSNPSATYAVFRSDGNPELAPDDVLEALAGDEPSNLVIVAASGGGILAAGWTAKVLSELNRAYPDLRRELRLISSVSGGSVGTAHYLLAHDRERGPLDSRALDQAVGYSMHSSLAATAFGLAFPDFLRIFLGPLIPKEYDRGRLVEMSWRNHSLPGRRNQDLAIAELAADVRSGILPAMIFNATVMETGERIAITPLSTLRRGWVGGEPAAASERLRKRFYYARTLSEFLGRKNAYTVDLWTGARLSATFSYVSPAVSASLVTPGKGNTASEPLSPEWDFHLIDGGYYDNYGVASALDWLTASIEGWFSKHPDQPLPFRRVALIEIRARPSASEARAARRYQSQWFGPIQGLMGSWSFAQRMSNDTLESQAFHYLKSTAEGGREFRSFVFVPAFEGPLSWHLSEEQKKEILAAWQGDANQQELNGLLTFLKQ